jgi:DNA topoisomerase-3
LQTLYEQHKLVTYPRTSSQYLTPDMLLLVKTVIQYAGGFIPRIYVFLCRQVASEDERGHVQPNRLSLSNNLVFDATKVSKEGNFRQLTVPLPFQVKDHPALMPTGVTPPASLAAPQAKLYQLVRRRFLAAFMPDCLKGHTELLARFGSEDIGSEKKQREGADAGELFRGTVTRIVSPGWRWIYGTHNALQVLRHSFRRHVWSYQ